MHISPITQAQVDKITKAIGYSFFSAAIAALVATNYDLSKQALLAVVVAGVNGVLVTIKQLVTQG